MCCTFCYVHTDHSRMWKHKTRWMRTATHCNTLQHTATHCITLHYTALHCNSLQHTATHLVAYVQYMMFECANTTTCMQSVTHCITLHYTVTLNNTFCCFFLSIKIQNPITYNTLHYTATKWSTLQYTATHFVAFLVHIHTESNKL